MVSSYDVPPAENWFKALPYAFKTRIDGEVRIFFLPISPQNISVSTHFATNIVATLTSTVEEHSPIRYFDISITGTTGFTPQYTQSYSKEDARKKAGVENKAGVRKSYGQSGSILKSINEFDYGFASKTFSKINQIVNVANDLIKGKKHSVGVYNDTNGYIAFHNFYRFLRKYKEQVIGFEQEASTTTPLIFINYKDGCQYSCVVQRFVLERSADNPLLYNYNIQMRAYNLQAIGADERGADQPIVSPLKDKKALAASIFNKVGKVKNLVNGALGAIGTFGR